MRASQFVLLAFVFASLPLSAQAVEKEGRQAMSIGTELNEFSGSFGVGANFTSPYYFENSFAVRITFNQAWLPATVGTEQTWYGFQVLRVGLVGGSIMKDMMRMYGVGGLLVGFPNSAFSSSTVVGGFGAFGFEFISGHSVNYFIELGALGTGAQAEKVAGQPIYLNGFQSTVGFRYSL